MTKTIRKVSKLSDKKIADKVYLSVKNAVVKIANKNLGFSNRYYYNNSEVKSSVDMKIEGQLVDFILKSWGNEFGIVSEEKQIKSIEKRYCFFIDPIDGTRNFIAKNPLFSVSVGLWDLEKGQPVLGIVYCPALKELFTWRNGQKAQLNGKTIKVSSVSELNKAILGVTFLRNPLNFSNNWERMGSYYKKLSGEVYGFRLLQGDALTVCWVACGRLDGACLVATRSFDIAGALAILFGANGKTFQLVESECVNLKTEGQMDVLVANQNIINKIQKAMV